MEKILRLNIALFMIIALAFSLLGCSLSTTGSSNNITEGCYEGTAPGFHGDLKLITEIDKDGKIVSITVGDNNETKNIGTIAIDKIPQRIIEAQSLEVDVVSGATVTSEAIINAAADSLETAGADISQYGYVSPSGKTEYELPPINKDAMPVKKETTSSVTVTDAKGRSVTIDLPISSYAVSTMDVIDYIIPLKGKDAFNMLVGSGQDGGHGLNKYAELYIPVVGNYMEHTGQISEHNAPFDLEMILSMDPDVLIANSAMAAHKYALEIEDQLTQAGIPIVLVDVPGKKLEESVQETMKILGQVFQEEEKAAEVSGFIDEQYDLIACKNLSEREDKPTVYYEKSGYSEIYGSTATSVSGWGVPAAIAGAENIADPVLLETAAEGGGGNTLDPEYVIEADPDYIIVSGINDGWLSCLKETWEVEFDIVDRTGWSDLKAVENNNLYEFAHAANRSIYAFYPCLKMAKIFYPEDFKDVDPEAALNEFFDKFMILDSDITTWFMTLEDITSPAN